MQRARDARGLERFVLAELGAQRHQAGHLGFGDLDFLATPGGEGNVLDDMVGHGVGFLIDESRLYSRRRPAGQ